MTRPAKDRPIELQLWLYAMDAANWLYRKTRSELAEGVYLWCVGKASECWVADDEVRPDGLEEPF